MESVKAELLLITNNFWQALADRDIEKRFLQCADTITFIGTGLDEKASGKEEYIAINKKGVEQYPEKFKLNILWERASVIEDMGWVENETEWTQIINGKEEKTLIRNTIVLKKTSGKWWIMHVHGSVPDFRLSGQNYITNAETIKINRELEREVYQRTKELNQKNRELEIESSLERVRTVAMGMRKPDDMLEVCQMISDQLKILGISEIRNVQTAIVEGREDGHYMNYQFFPQYDKRIIEDVEIGKHPNVQAMISRMQQSPDAFFSHSFTGLALEEWKQYRKDDHQFPDPILDDANQVHFYFYSIGQGGLGLSAYTLLTENQIALFQRFRNVFTLAYQRFRDIEQAEAQAREAQIEASLERVRTRSMAMQKSEELKEVIQVVYAQFIQLNIHIEHTGFVMDYKARDDHHIWIADNVASPAELTIPYFDAVYYNQFNEAKAKGLDFFATLLTFEQKNKFYQDLFKHVPGLPEEALPFLMSCPGLAASTVLLENIGLYIENFSGIPFTDEENATLMRFGKVFQQTYTRFLDLKKAEEQAKEAQIEAALERVRSRTMAMHSSNELQDAAILLFQQIRELGADTGSCGYVIWENDIQNATVWMSSAEGGIQDPFKLPHTKSEIYKEIYSAKEEGKEFFAKEVSGVELKKHFDYLTTVPGIGEKIKQLRKTGYTFPETIVYNTAFFNKGYLSFHTYEQVPDAHDIFRRFAKVFEQTFTRFQDLIKAEANAKEAKIEAALERVRAKAMAMHSSEDLATSIDVFFSELNALHIHPHRCGFGINDAVTQTVEMYATTATHNHEIKKVHGILKLSGHPVLDGIFEQWLLQKEYHPVLRGQEILDYYKVMNPQVTVPDFAHDETQYGYYFFFKEGGVFAWFDKEVDESVLQIFRRFTSVMSLTHRRYMDLKEAEAQTRESQIETALERVRSRTLAMHKSDELAETAAVVFRQLISLGIAPNRLYIAIIHDDNGELEFWITDEDGTKVSTQFMGHKDKNDSIRKMYDGWADQKKSITISMEGKELQEYFHYLNDELLVPFKQGLSQKRRVQNIAYFSKGFIGIASPDDQPLETLRLLERFAAVFNLTYTRFNDLQQAEAQTHKAKIEVALERVRARALAMQEPEELVEVAQLMRHEMGLLGVEELETSSIYIHDEGADIADCWYAIKDIKSPEKKLVADHIRMELHLTWVGRQMLDFYNSNQQQTSIVMQGANRIEWINYCSSISDVLVGFYGEVIPNRTYHLYKFSNGALGAAAEGDISEESWELLRRATSVFSLAYSRFKDLTQARVDLQRLKTEKQRAEDALDHLKSAQAQLVQSEKMASLGELTAGIAHEIQNPLNFVNNFSDVNTELIEEMKVELASGNNEEAIAIANDIADNEQKINHHGKRADAIVKGMLQHSRSSSGVKEPNDINVLADEYLRLAYHGLRAKDNKFNATMKTDFDQSIGKIDIISQDIGRVMLNLITNAFYAVNEKKKQQIPGYEPIVSVTSEKKDDQVLIYVKDNGNGIPPSILDKIFQPFFTTKPTGQGTGLGLSLSYDIVKAHGGELTVATKEGEGTTFTIQLPIT